jgi:hypothetical protein
MNGIPVYIALTEEPTCVHTASRLPWQQIGSLVIAYMSLLSEEGDMINRSHSSGWPYKAYRARRSRNTVWSPPNGSPRLVISSA